MDASDLLDSDQRIMAATTVRDGVLSFNFGDGQPPLRGTLDGVLNSKQIIQWCNAVRSTYRARQDSKENQAASPAPVVQEAHGQVHAAPAVSSGGGLPVEEGVEGVKAAMVAGIESSLAHLGRREVALLEERGDHVLALERLDVELASLAETTRYYQKLKEAVCET